MSRYVELDTPSYGNIHKPARTARQGGRCPYGFAYRESHSEGCRIKKELRATAGASEETVGDRAGRSSDERRLHIIYPHRSAKTDIGC